MTLVGFLGMLHPAEFAPLLRSDLLLPQESLMDNSIFYVHIRQPKTALFARRQHCKVDDLLTLGFIEKIYGHLGPDEPLFQGGMSAYRRRWNVVLARLQGIPVSHAVNRMGATPAVLRGSGAAFMHLQCEDLNRVQWRGRWSQFRAVEHYIQEVAAQTLLHTLDPCARHRIKSFSDAATSLLISFLVDSVKAL